MATENTEKKPAELKDDDLKRVAGGAHKDVGTDKVDISPAPAPAPK